MSLPEFLRKVGKLGQEEDTETIFSDYSELKKARRKRNDIMFLILFLVLVFYCFLPLLFYAGHLLESFINYLGGV